MGKLFVSVVTLRSIKLYNLSSIEDVKSIQSELRVVFESPSGKQVMKFLEGLCGWYDFKEMQTEPILIQHGGRRILATIKTLLELNPEQVVAITKEQ